MQRNEVYSIVAQSVRLTVNITESDVELSGLPHNTEMKSNYIPSFIIRVMMAMACVLSERRTGYKVIISARPEPIALQEFSFVLTRLGDSSAHIFKVRDPRQAEVVVEGGLFNADRLVKVIRALERVIDRDFLQDTVRVTITQDPEVATKRGK